ncbi:MAG: hypothetical protein IPH18_06705 [Chitinophagaceae bacterium]|nr:hypothetical protein [Chitinophagaceae bacterium]MBK8951140.1 hypothetical protein [Chitinophagaceae bacterium]
MRVILTFFSILLIQSIFAQDKTLLKKHLLQILIDYPNKFKSLEDPANPFTLKFSISGTTNNGIIMGSGSQVYISSSLPLPKSAEDAKTLFQKWTGLIDQIDFNGVKMTGVSCPSPCDKFTMYSRKWSFDTKRTDLDTKYFPFKIVVQIIKIGESYAAAILIGQLE